MLTPAQVQEAFEAVGRQPEPAQALLRNILIQVLQDPATMRSLGTHDLAAHLALAGQVLIGHSRAGGSSASLPRKDVFVNLTVGHDFSDAEEGYHYATTLPEGLRERVEDALFFTIQSASSPRAHDDTISLLALARLLAIALKDPAFVTHVAKGLEVEPFLEHTQRGHAPRSPAVKNRYQTRSTAKHVEHALPAPDARCSWHERYIGNMVEIVVSAPPDMVDQASGRRLIVMRGRCLEATSTYVIVSASAEHAAQSAWQDPVLFGISNLVYMRIVQQ